MSSRSRRHRQKLTIIDCKRIWSYEDSKEPEEIKIGRLRRLILVDVK